MRHFRKKMATDAFLKPRGFEQEENVLEGSCGLCYLIFPWESTSCLSVIEKEDWSPSKDTLSK